MKKKRIANYHRKKYEIHSILNIIEKIVRKTSLLHLARSSASSSKKKSPKDVRQRHNYMVKTLQFGGVVRVRPHRRGLLRLY